MTRKRGTVQKAVEQGFKRRGVPHDRADLIHRLLIADGPLSTDEIKERLGMSDWQVTGSGQALQHLLADGRAFSRLGHGNARMYYATEDGEDVPCNCTGLSHKDTCPN